MSFTLEHAKHHVPRFKLEQRIINVPPVDRGGNLIDGRLAAWGGVGHWFGSGYQALGTTYHIPIQWNAADNTATIVQRIRLRDKGSHVWRRNTGLIAVSFAAMSDIIKNGRKVGVNWPKDVQVFAMAYTFAALAGVLGWNLEGTQRVLAYRHDRQARGGQGDLIRIPGYHDAPIITPHSWWAQRRIDDYEDHRWDVGTYWGGIFPLALRFREWMRAGEIPNRFQGWVTI